MITTPKFNPVRPRQIFKWRGSKVILAEWYCSFIPPHIRWVDVCCGTASMTIAKTPSSLEVINDLDGHVVNFFRVLQDEDKHVRLLRRIENSVASKELHKESVVALERDGWADDVDRAWMFWMKQWGGAPMNTKTFMLPKFKPTKPDPKREPSNLEMVRDRLQLCYIENRGALEIIGRMNEADTCLFIDPPYEDTNQNGYNQETDSGFHEELVAQLLKIEAKVMLCGYPNPRYDVLVEAGWRKEEREVNSNTCNYAKGVYETRRVECLWVKSWNGLDGADAGSEPPPCLLS